MAVSALLGGIESRIGLQLPADGVSNSRIWTKVTGSSANCREKLGERQLSREPLLYSGMLVGHRRHHGRQPRPKAVDCYPYGFEVVKEARAPPCGDQFRARA